MRAIVGLLRDSDDGRTPQPGLEQVEELATKARDAGLDIKLEATSPVTPPPSAVGTAAYRILQEALTNVIHHVGPTRVTVALDYGVDAVEIRVVDEGRQEASGPHVPSQHASNTGKGIAGMRERCQLLGGELTAGSLPSGGFEVSARLPLTPTGTAQL
jgi:signal transduction histidine kinase